MHKKMEKLLYANGIEPLNTTILETKMVDGKTIIIIETEGVKYEIDGLNKKVISEKEIDPTLIKLMEDYKISDVEVIDDILFIDGESTEKTIENWINDKKVYDNVAKTETKKPRGWHFRPVYVDSDENVYHHGQEQSELKGTLPISQT